MGGSCLAERLAHYVSLTEAEEAALRALETQERTYRRGAVVRREHDAPRELFIVQKGWLHSCVILHSGSRQIMRFHFPGDLVGGSILAYGTAADSIVAVTDVTVCPFDRERLATLFEDHPRLGALILALSIAERVALADRLASVGRTAARARVGALFCEIASRLRVMEGRDLAEFHLPLTQEEIGDATGLTAVHVNRMIRGLEEDGLIEREGNMVRMLDPARLCHEVNFTDRYASLDTSWLPPSR